MQYQRDWAWSSSTTESSACGFCKPCPHTHRIQICADWKGTSRCGLCTRQVRAIYIWQTCHNQERPQTLGGHCQKAVKICTQKTTRDVLQDSEIWHQHHLQSSILDHNSPLQSSLSSEENGALSTRRAVLVINKQIVRLNLLSRRPRASSGRQRKAKVTPSLQYLQHETPLQNTYGFESSAKTAGKTHQKPTAHNSWTPQTTACQHRRHQQANQNVSTKVRALLQQKRDLPHYKKEILYAWDHKHWMRRHGTKQWWQKDWMNNNTWLRQKMHPTSKTEWIFKRHKKWTTQIPVASKDLKSTQEMAVKTPDPYASQPLSIMSPSNDQKSCSTQATTAPPRSKKPELGRHNKSFRPTSVSVPTETRPRRVVREPAYLKD